MKVWLPAVRSNSGSDVYVRRLSSLLESHGVETTVTWFSGWHELLPWSMSMSRPPLGTNIIHANTWQAFAFAGRGVPLVATAHHCVAGRGYPEWKSLAQAAYHNYWIGPFERRSFDSASAIVAVSRSTANEMASYFGRTDIAVIENWIELDVFMPGARGYGPPKVLFVGNLSKRKGADLLAAFRAALPAGVELHVVAGSRQHGVRALSAVPGVKVWRELSLEDLLALYRQADVFVSLSRHEGFGYAAAEAMACEKPVVAFDVSGLRDVVVSGETGWLIEPGDVNGLVTACMDLVESPARSLEMGRAGRCRVQECFSAKHAIQGYLSLYEKMLA